MRAIAAKQITHDQHGNEIVMALVGARIEVFHSMNGTKGKYLAVVEEAGGGIGRFTSLHKAKNAIRRHFGIESRKMLRWEEEIR